jgi:hypothetical protein
MKQVFIKKASITLLLLLTPLFLNSQTQIGNDIDGEAAGDQSGISVAVSSNGSIIAIGAISNDGNGIRSGHVRVYRNNNGTWEQIGSDIDGEAAEDLSGGSISLSSDGSIVAIGAQGNDGTDTYSGHVRVYKNTNNNWVQIGADINGEAITDSSGTSVSLSSDGSIVAIGADDNDGNGIGSGHVRVYRNTNGTWVQIGNDIDGEAAGDVFGSSVSISSNGNIIAIGAWGNDGNGSGSGHVRVYKNTNNTWLQTGSDIDGEAAQDSSGHSVCLSSDGNTIAIGGRNNSGNGFNSGYSRIYQNINNVWTQKGIDIDGEEVADSSGWAVSLSSDGNIVIIGAPGNDGNGTNSGHVRVYNLSTVLKTTDFLISKFNVFPNPVKNYFTIQLKENIVLKKVTIYNNIGQFIKSSKKLITDTSTLSKGIYVLKIETDKGTASKKLVIK